MEQNEPTLNIPQEQAPVSNEANPVASVEFLPAAAPETARTAERPSGSGTTPTVQENAAAQASVSQPSSSRQPSNSSSATDAPAIADDVDVLEKEWVDKAKSIVEATRDDPYTQNKEVSKLKADYMQKRYGKEIKLTND